MERVIAVTRALADSKCLRALAVLFDHDGLCACHIIALLDLAPATVSRHMALLVDAGLVSSWEKGRWVYYRLSDSLSPLMKQWLVQSWSRSTQAAVDRAVLEQILACDRTELCACWRAGRRVAALGAVGISDTGGSDGRTE